MGIFGGKGIKINADRDYKEGDEVRTDPPATEKRSVMRGLRSVLRGCVCRCW